MSPGSRRAASPRRKTTRTPRSAISTEPEAVLGSPQAILEIRDELLLAVRGRGEAGMRARSRREPPGGVRPCEQRHLDRGVGRNARQLVELRVGLHEDTRSLRDAVHAHVERRRPPPAPLEAPRALGRRDLDAILAPSGNRFVRVGKIVEISLRQDRGSEGSSGPPSSRSYDVGSGDGSRPTSRPVRGRDGRRSPSRSSCAPTSATG